MEPFAFWVDYQMRQQKLTQAQLARRAGVDRATISRLLALKTDPSFGIALAIITALRFRVALEPIDEEASLRVLGSFHQRGDRPAGARVVERSGQDPIRRSPPNLATNPLSDDQSLR